MRILLALCTAAVAAAGCTSLDGDRILGSDLGRADQRLTGLPAGFVAGFAPLPGVQRVFEARDLVRIARAHGLSVDELGPLCFERKSEPLTEGRLREALLPLLPANATLEILDYSRHSLPVGELKFGASDLGRPPANQPAGPVLWRGRLVYGTNSSVVVWAKVRVVAKEKWVATARAIPAGREIEAADVVVLEEERFPFLSPPVREMDAVIGKAAARMLPQGQVLTTALLGAPHDVRSGDIVEVEVASGGVRLRLEARVFSSGRVDDVVLVGLETGRKVKAMVRGKGKVVIDAAR
jgi:flagella basal body P-ring formation protein FlgA